MFFPCKIKEDSVYAEKIGCGIEKIVFGYYQLLAERKESIKIG